MAERINREPYQVTYGEIVETFGEILAEAHDHDYQGDSLYLIRDTTTTDTIKFGIATVGWGSCSGCDALEACTTQADLNELQDALENGIKWYDSADDIREYINSKDSFGGSFLRDSLVAEFKSEFLNAEKDL